ncbi:MAG: glycosyltransferase family 4 protein [Bacteroidetes bacterium]|nr:glycosyltransferase family 4 protein [Bacteroidota bacterium]MDA1119374.1 glycosyltransferase family 4 protein [Bacteroidota bacterium]
MKRVLMFGWEYPPEISGGLGIATHGLLAGLAKKGLKIQFVMPNAPKKAAAGQWKILSANDAKLRYEKVSQEEYWANLSYIEIGSKLLPYISPESFQISRTKKRTVKLETKFTDEGYEFKGGYGSNLMEEVARFAIVAAEISAHQDFDIIHAHDWMTFPAALAAGEQSGKPVVLHIHSTEIERSSPQISQGVYDLERLCLHKASHIIAVSHLTKNILQKHYEVDAMKISVVHNSFAEVFDQPAIKKSFPSDKPTITFVGRFTKQKAPGFFIDIAKTLNDRNSDYRFVMAGDGYLLNDIKKKVHQHNLTKKFEFPGFISLKKVRSLFLKTDIFLITSSAEPFGMVALEAAHSGVPVVMTNQTGAGEVLTSAKKFNCWETFKLANAVEALVKNPVETLKYAYKLQAEAGKRTWDKAADEVIEIYDELC